MSSSLYRSVPLFVAATLLWTTPGCAPQRGGEGSVGPIGIQPAEATLVAPMQQTAKFIATSSDGNITKSATWSLADGSFGSISAGIFTVDGNLAAGGTTMVMARKGNDVGSAILHVKYVAPDVIEAGAPDDAPDEFGGPASGQAPAPVYPFDGVMLARNISQMRLAWRAAPGQTLFRIAIDSPTYKRSFYLGAHACNMDKCSYLVANDDWALLAQSVSGGKATLTLSGTAGTGQPVGTAPALGLNFSPEDVRGGLYYFSTSRLGLLRLPFGGTRAVPFLLGTGDDTSVDRCIGCHAVSADGKKVAAVWAGGDGYGGIVDGVDPTKFLYKPIPPQFGDPMPSPGQVWNFASFSPDGGKLIGVWKGELSLRSGDNASLITKVDPSFVGGRASMPEWSPDGKWIVFVRIPEPEGRLGADISMRDPNTGQLQVPAGDWILGNAGDIAILPYNDGVFGPAVTVVPHQAGQEYHFYPSFSPDSQWIVFNSAAVDNCYSPTAALNGVDVTGRCMTYDQRAARLRLVRAQEGSTPIELMAATHLANTTTAWPKFAPFQQAGGKLVFFTFSAKFDYGWVVQQDQIQMMTGRERPQIWMSAIDLGKAASGSGDPSFAPFWLPFQDYTTNNHEVIWTRDIACSKAADCSGGEFDCVNGVCVPKLG